ncbi:MAG: NAD(P)/FAD-dependent oxidoreductase [Anaerolineales bacterium]
MDTTADVILIGGGIHGASLAFHLAQRGLKPLILEKRFLAAGATGRSSGLVRMHYDLEPESRLAWLSFQYFRDWKEWVGGDCGFTRTGFIYIPRQDHTDAMRANIAMHQRLGIPSLEISAEDVRRLAPSFSVEDFELAAYEPESGYADPNLSTGSLIEAARRQGTRLLQGYTVTGVLLEGGKVKGVHTDQGDFFAPLVVDAAGAWAAGVARLAGLELPLTTWRHDTMFIQRPAELHLTHPTVIDDANAMYFRPESGSLTLVGLEDGNPIGLSPDGQTDVAQAGFVERAIERICRRIPLMEKGALHSAHGGFDGITSDQRAILGPAGPDGFYLARGFSGTGFKIAPAVGLCMTEWMLDGKPVSVDVTPFSLTRFDKGEKLSGEHAYDDIWR